jgi:hypothetical protein
MSVNLDWCSGCDVPLNKRVNLPDGWVEGDLILEGVTIHTERVRDDTGFEAFFQWIKDNNAFDAMQRRVSVTFVKEFMDSHEGKLPPPGIQVSREYVCRVRKPK